jgi:hypothetical protein
MTRHISDAELGAAVRRELERQHRSIEDLQYGTQAQKRGFVRELVHIAVTALFGVTVGGLIEQGINAVWNFLVERFSW